MRIQEVMSDPVFFVTQDSPAEDAWQVMQTHGVRHLIVKDGSKVVGTLSDSDAGGPWGASVRAGASVLDLMDRRVATIRLEDTVRSAANLMRGRGIGCLAVMDGGRLVGVVTIADLLKVVGGGVDRPQQPARPAVNHKVPHRKASVGAGRW